MNPDAPPPPRAARLHEDVDGSARHGEDLPQSSGAPMAEHRSVAVREYGGQPQPTAPEARVPDCVYASMEPVQAGGRELTLDRIRAEAEVDELPICDHAMLPGCDLRHTFQTFPAHTAGKVWNVGFRPPRPLLPAEIAHGQEDPSRRPGTEHDQALDMMRQPAAGDERASQAVDHVAQRQHARGGVDHGG
jgi:hypothetical protein